MNAVTIILIEDDDGHARLVEKNLRRAGVSNPITRCADGESAVQCLFGGGCAGHLLVLLDLNLPDMSGIDILQRLKTDLKLGRTPVVVLTTTDDKIEASQNRSTTSISPTPSNSSGCSWPWCNSQRPRDARRRQAHHPD
jgi:CheY-like chemotaxis protein